MPEQATDPGDLQGAKKALRQSVIARRDALEAGVRSSSSRLIAEKLLALPEYQAAHAVAAYASFGSEPDTSAFLQATLASGKRLILPRINKADRRLELHQITDLRSGLLPGVWGIREPAQSAPRAQATEVEFILVPGVAFTRDGRRLGYGGGFYDRLLATIRPSVRRIAAAFSLQIMDDLPVTPRDERVHCLVSELSVLETGTGQPF